MPNTRVSLILIFEQALIDDGIDTNPTIDGKILTADAEAATTLYLQYKNISDLTGIEAFINITSLQCFNNNLTSLILGSHPDLGGLNCSENSITSMDISNCPSLHTLICTSNDLVFARKLTTS